MFRLEVQGSTVPTIILSFIVLIVVFIVMSSTKTKGDGVMKNKRNEIGIIILKSLSTICTDLTGGALLT